MALLNKSGLPDENFYKKPKMPKTDKKTAKPIFKKGQKKAKLYLRYCYPLS